MKIEKNTVVSLRYKLTDAQNNIIEEPDSPMVYLHGGYDGTFPKIETALDGQDVGYETTLQLDPGDAFGEYDPELLKIEPRTRFPEPLEVGMQFEGVPDADDFSNDANTQTLDINEIPDGWSIGGAVLIVSCGIGILKLKKPKGRAAIQIEKDWADQVESRL